MNAIRPPSDYRPERAAALRAALLAAATLGASDASAEHARRFRVPPSILPVEQTSDEDMAPILDGRAPMSAIPIETDSASSNAGEPPADAPACALDDPDSNAEEPSADAHDDPAPNDGGVDAEDFDGVILGGEPPADWHEHGDGGSAAVSPGSPPPPAP